MESRDKKGRFASLKSLKSLRKPPKTYRGDHDYAFIGCGTSRQTAAKPDQLHLPGKVSRDGWKVGRRLIELRILLDNLEYCGNCKLGSVPLTKYSVVGELRKGLSGYLYVKCDNIDCEHVNRVAYGKTHRVKGKGMPCFAANTKLGIAMIDSIGGSGKVNNMLSTLNIDPINRRNLQDKERRAGRFVEFVAKQSKDAADREAFDSEMIEVSQEESRVAATNMEGLIKDLGVAPLPDASPTTKSILQASFESTTCSNETTENPSPEPRRHKLKRQETSRPLSVRGNILSKYRPKSRYGMSASVDTAWQKRGFDSRTSHTVFMSSSKRGNKVLKSVVSHRQCSTCNWWRRYRPGKPVRQHRCVRNHSGSARSTESESGEKAILYLAKKGTPVQILEGDGDNTLLARLQSKHGISLKKKYDKNHVMKNLGKSLYGLQNEKGIKISKITIAHIQKCVSYALSKNSVDLTGLQENLHAIVPHNFGDHQLCQPRFCDYLRKQGHNIHPPFLTLQIKLHW